MHLYLSVYWYFYVTVLFKQYLISICGGVHGRVVRVVDLESLVPHHCGFESQQGLDSFMWGSHPASLRNVGGSTQVPTCAWNNAQRGTWGLPPPVKMESCHITFTVLVWRKSQMKIYTRNTYFISSLLSLCCNVSTNILASSLALSAFIARLFMFSKLPWSLFIWLTPSLYT